MRKTSGRRAGSLLLVAGVALLAVFLVLLYLLKRQGDDARGRFTPDEELLAELQGAEMVDDGPPATADWPQWRGPRRDGVAGADSLRLDWPAAGPPLLWRKPIGEGYSSFAVAAGRLYAHFRENGQEVVACWQADTGDELWRHAHEVAYENGYGSGPRATPTLAGGKLYTVGVTGVLHCLDAANGTALWQHDLLTEFNAPNLEWGITFSPLVENGLVYTMPGGPGGNSLAAFRADTGELAWKSQDDPAGNASPVAATIGGVRQVLFFTATHLVGVTADAGQLLWRYPWPTAYGINAATPIVFRARRDGRELHYVFISSGYGKGCGVLKIEPSGGGSFQARPVYEGTQMRNHFATSVLLAGHVYGFDETNLVCLDVRSGEVKWKKPGFQKGTLAAAGGFLIVLGEQGKLALVEATPEEYREKASFRPFRSQRCWTMPVLAGGLLLVRDLEQAACYDVRGNEMRKGEQ